MKHKAAKRIWMFVFTHIAHLWNASFREQFLCERDEQHIAEWEHLLFVLFNCNTQLKIPVEFFISSQSVTLKVKFRKTFRFYPHFTSAFHVFPRPLHLIFLCFSPPFSCLSSSHFDILAVLFCFPSLHSVGGQSEIQPRNKVAVL